jgi:hypothetical protein
VSEGTVPSPALDVWPSHCPSLASHTSRQLRNIIDSLHALRATVDFHSFGQVVFSPWLYDERRPVHARMLDRAGMEMRRNMNAVAGRIYDFPGAGGNTMYTASGTMVDWVFAQGQQLRIPTMAFVVELRPVDWRPGFMLPASEIGETGEEVLAATTTLAQIIASGDIESWAAEATDGMLTALLPTTLTCAARRTPSTVLRR